MQSWSEHLDSSRLMSLSWACTSISHCLYQYCDPSMRKFILPVIGNVSERLMALEQSPNLACGTEFFLFTSALAVLPDQPRVGMVP